MVSSGPIRRQTLTEWMQAGRKKWALLDLNQNTQGVSNKKVIDNPKNAMVHNQVHDSHFAKDLQQIINQWDELPEHVRQTIRMLVDTAGKKVD